MSPRTRPRWRAALLIEPWSTPFALVNGSAVGLVPILLPLAAERYALGHIGLVMGAFNLGALGAPLAGSLADRYRAYRSIAAACAAGSAVSLWLFPLGGPLPQLLLGGSASGTARRWQCRARPGTRRRGLKAGPLCPAITGLSAIAGRIA